MSPRLATLCAAWALAVTVVLSYPVKPTGQAPAQQPAAPRPAAGGQERVGEPPALAGPVVTMETDKGSIVFETYPDDAPKTVAHVMALVEKGFYDGQRFHRAEPGFVVQFGDPQSRDLDLRARWGRGPGDGSGTPIGVAEFSKRRPNIKGAVGMAHAGNPMKADSQIYITLDGLPAADGLFVVFGQVVRGEDVLLAIQRGDIIRRVTAARADAGR
jgi:cyclophilin family peptidyl-prolyl cis-trans isomerase